MLKVNIHKNIKSIRGDALLEIEASIRNNSITGIYGNSGEGKSTFFDIIAGLTSPDKGFVIYNDTKWFCDKNRIQIPTQQRDIGYIFQENNLFPHFTVKDNVLYALPIKNRKTADISSPLKEVDMTNMEDRYPRQLSGGQIQRVAIVRALIQKAGLILMDEPFSALDLGMKQKLYKILKKFKVQYKPIILIITHDLNDLLYLCEQVIWIVDHKARAVMSNESFKKAIKAKIEKL